MQTRQKRNLGVADAEDRVFALDRRAVLRGHTDLTGKALLAELELAPGGTKMPADMTGYRTGSIGMYRDVSSGIRKTRYSRYRRAAGFQDR
jgi:hypothetical protein